MLSFHWKMKNTVCLIRRCKMLNTDFENKERAKQINLISFLNAEYPDMIFFDRKKKEWRIKYNNIKISALSFYDFDNAQVEITYDF